MRLAQKQKTDRGRESPESHRLLGDLEILEGGLITPVWMKCGLGKLGGDQLCSTVNGEYLSAACKKIEGSPCEYQPRW